MFFHYVMDVLFLITFLYVIISNWETIKNTYQKLTILQLIFVVLSFLMTIAIATILIYYGVNWLAGFIAFQPLKMMVKFILAALILFGCGSGLNKVVKRGTNGVL